MREIRTYGSEGGAAQANAPSLPLSGIRLAKILAAVARRLHAHPQCLIPPHSLMRLPPPPPGGDVTCT